MLGRYRSGCAQPDWPIAAAHSDSRMLMEADRPSGSGVAACRVSTRYVAYPARARWMDFLMMYVNNDRDAPRHND